MPNYFFIVTITLLTLCISFVSTKGTLSDLRRKWHKVFTKRGKWAIALTVCVIGLLVWQNWQADSNNDTKEDKLKKERDQRDSIITAGINKGVDSASKKLFNDLSQALAKQDLQFDSSQKRIAKLVKDSSNKTTTIINGNDPVLTINSIVMNKRNNDSASFSIIYGSLDAGSSFLDIQTSIVVSRPQIGFRYIGIASPFPYKAKIGKNTGKIASFGVKGKATYTMLYAWVRGTYKNVDGSKTFNIDEVYAYDIAENKGGDSFPKTRDSVINIISLSEKYK